MQRNKDIIFIAPLLTVVSFLTLFIFRSWDDNRLTSWHWVFGQVEPVKVFFALSAGCGFISAAEGLFFSGMIRTFDTARCCVLCGKK